MKIKKFCDEQGLGWSEEAEERFERYLDLLLQFNEKMNLIGPMGRAEAEETLILDSLVAAIARVPRGAILDVGTGAGLPGIPLKILYPDCPIALVEPRQKRSNFLKLASHRLGLKDVEVHRVRIEEFEGGGFDFVISKAFEAPTKWLETGSMRRAADGGVMVMGRRRDRGELDRRAEELGLAWVSQAEGPREHVQEDPEDRVVFAYGSA